MNTRHQKSFPTGTTSTNVPVGNVAPQTIPARHTLPSRRAILAGLAALPAAGVAAAKTVTDDNGFVEDEKKVADGDVFFGREKAVPDENSFFSAEDRFHHHLGYAAMALSELRCAEDWCDGDLWTLGRFLLHASPAEMRRYHSNRLLDLLDEHRPGAWRYAVLSNATCVVFIRDSDGISRPSEGFEA